MRTDNTIPPSPAGFATVNPFVITRDADGLIGFVRQVFNGMERLEARTMDHDGLLLHAELAVGDATIMFGERKRDWPFTPSLLQVYVDDVEYTLTVARRLGATVVTEPTEVFGDLFARFRDPWSNMWWVHRHGGQGWGGEDEAVDWSDAGAADDAQDWQPTSPELTYIHDTLLTGMRDLADPEPSSR